MSDRKREPPQRREPPQFMKPGDSPELDRKLNQLRFDSDIYEPGEYDVFGQRRNLKALRPSLRVLPPWGAAPPEGTDASGQPEGSEPTALPEAADQAIAPEHAEPAAPPVASAAPDPKALARPQRARLALVVLAGCAALVAFVWLRPRVEQGPPPQSSGAVPPSAASPAPTASVMPRATPSAEPARVPQIPSAAPTASAAVPPPQGPSRAPTGRRKAHDVNDNPHDTVVPSAPLSAAPLVPAPPPPPTAPVPKPTPPELLTN